MKKIITSFLALLIIISSLSSLSCNSAVGDNTVNTNDKESTANAASEDGETTISEITSAGGIAEAPPAATVDDKYFNPDCEHFFIEKPLAGKDKLEYCDTISAVVTSVYSKDAPYIYFDMIFPAKVWGDTPDDIGNNIGIWDYYNIEMFYDSEWRPIPMLCDSNIRFEIGHLPFELIKAGNKIINSRFETSNLCQPLAEGYYRIVVFLNDGTNVYAYFKVA